MKTRRAVRIAGAALVAALIVSGVAAAWNVIAPTNPGNDITAASLGAVGSLASTRVPPTGNSCTGFDLTWTAATNADRYRVRRRISGTWTELAASQAATSYTDSLSVTHYTVDYEITPLLNGTLGEGPPEIVASTCGIGDVEDLEATLAPDCLSTTLSWTPAFGADRYRVRRRVNGGGWSTNVANITSAPWTWTDTTVHPAHATVEYLIESRNRTTVGNVSNLVSVTNFGCLVPPTNVQAVPSCGDTDVTWDAALGATAYRVQRRINGGTWANRVSNHPATSWTDTNSPAIGATVEYQVFSYNGTLLDTVPSSITSPFRYGFFIESVEFVNVGTAGTLDVGDQVIVTFSLPVAPGDVTQSQIITVASGGNRGIWLAASSASTANTDIVRIRTPNNHFSNGTLSGSASFDADRRVWTWTSSSSGVSQNGTFVGDQVRLGTSGARAQCDGNNDNLSTTVPNFVGGW